MLTYIDIFKLGKITIQLVLNDFFIWFFVIGHVTQIWITIQIWTSKCNYFLTTEQLFVNPLYCSLLIDQSMSFNRRRDKNVTPFLKQKNLRSRNTDLVY